MGFKKQCNDRKGFHAVQHATGTLLTQKSNLKEDKHIILEL